MLYIKTVLFDVYPLRDGRGGDDPVAALLAGPARGELVVRRRFPSSSDGNLTAQVQDVDTGKDLLSPLKYVRIVAIDIKGMVIEGQQTKYFRDTQKSKKDCFTQRWLCKLPGQPAVLDREKLLQRSAFRIRSHLASGFDPADDNCD